jgi:stearoyl-CoA 9-desaturase NADPH oxidoreductase
MLAVTATMVVMTSLLASPARKAGRRPLRRIAHLVATPLVPQDFIDLVRPLSSELDLRGRIEAIHAETSDAATVRIRVGRTWRGHVAGQFVRLGVDVDGVRQWRTYSITSPAGSTDVIAITVKTVPGGIVSNYLVHQAKVGTLVHLDQAAGDFTLPKRTPEKVLFVTAGSGITPVMGILRTHLDQLDDVVLVHSARTADDVIFAAELRAFMATGRLRLIERHTGTQSRLTGKVLDELVPDCAERHAWACGPAELLETIESHYAGRGLGDQLRTERFTAPAITVGEGGPVTFTRSGAEVDTDSSTTLLAAGEEAGVLMPSGCRMGVCFGCVVPLRNGAVRDIRNGEVITGAPDAGVLVQTCISTAAGTCELDV